MLRTVLCIGVLFSLVVGSACAAEDTRAPLPTKEEIQKARKLLKDAFESEISDATMTPEKTGTLIDQMIGVARLQSTKPAERVALLQQAITRAVTGGDATRTLSATRIFGTIFQIDTLGLAQRELGKVERHARSDQQEIALARAYLEAAQIAVEQERFEIADDMARKGKRYARTDKALEQRLNRLEDEIKEIRLAHQKAARAATVLRRTRTDPAASNIYGRYRCFYIEDWEGGLPFLRNASDKKLQQLAQTELSIPSQTESMVLLADAWWDFSASEDDFPKERIRGRAAYWYQKALPQTDGLTRRKVESRLQAYAEAKAEKK